MEFYKKCAELLGAEYDGEPFTHYKRTRWNNRKPGSGRFPGFGIIRKFGDKIQVALRHPEHHYKIYENEKEVLDYLTGLSYK